jgi:hypothetical protein
LQLRTGKEVAAHLIKGAGLGQQHQGNRVTLRPLEVQRAGDFEAVPDLASIGIGVTSICSPSAVLRWATPEHGGHRYEVIAPTRCSVEGRQQPKVSGCGRHTTEGVLDPGHCSAVRPVFLGS